MSLNSPTRFIVHATNVHSGGGLSLLQPLLMAMPAHIEVMAQLDSRAKPPPALTKNLTIKYVVASLRQRLRAEWWLAKHAMSSDLILCFGNLPPMFKLRGHTVVFVQNRYLIDDVSLENFPLKVRLRLGVERLWLSGRMANADEFIVQTPSMKRLLDLRTKGTIPVSVLPFAADTGGYVRKIRNIREGNNKVFDFVYVASGEPHKNHRNLIDAWCLLAKAGVFPSLKLTLDDVHCVELCTWIGHRIGEYRLNVENTGSVAHQDMSQLYSQSGALIYPSTFESFGLPLIEARQAGLPVLASELDYVRDVVDPEQTFDPESAVSIARAVKRFFELDDAALPLQDAEGFLKDILSRTK